MNYRLFQYPLPAPPELEDLNACLATHRISRRLRAPRVLERRASPPATRSPGGTPAIERAGEDARRSMQAGGRGRGIPLPSTRRIMHNAPITMNSSRCSKKPAWRRMVLTFCRTGDAQEPASRPARRLVEQHGEELPRREPQQERAREPEQEQRIPAGAGSRHGGATTRRTSATTRRSSAEHGRTSAETRRKSAMPPDDAHSRAPLPGGDETKGKTPAGFDIPAESREEKTPAGAPRREEFPW